MTNRYLGQTIFISWGKEIQIQSCQHDNVFRCIDHKIKTLKPPIWTLNSRINKWKWCHLTREKYRATQVHGWFLFWYVKSSKWSFSSSQQEKSWKTWKATALFRYMRDSRSHGKPWSQNETSAYSGLKPNWVDLLWYPGDSDESSSTSSHH